MVVRRALSDNQFLHIAEFKCKPIRDVEAFLSWLTERLGRHSQAVRADRVAGLRHVELAAIQAWEAWRQGLSKAQRLEVEFLLRLGCTDQISEAIRRVGLSVGTNGIVLVAVGPKRLNLEISVSKIGLKPYRHPSRRKLGSLMRLYRVKVEHLGMVQTLLGTRSKGEALPFCLSEMSSLIYS